MFHDMFSFLSFARCFMKFHHSHHHGSSFSVVSVHDDSLFHQSQFVLLYGLYEPLEHSIVSMTFNVHQIFFLVLIRIVSCHCYNVRGKYIFYKSDMKLRRTINVS